VISIVETSKRKVSLVANVVAWILVTVQDLAHARYAQ